MIFNVVDRMQNLAMIVLFCKTLSAFRFSVLRVVPRVPLDFVESFTEVTVGRSVSPSDDERFYSGFGVLCQTLT